MKRKIRIPVVVTRTGAMAAGCASVDSHGQQSLFEMDGVDTAIDSLDDIDYDSGYQVVHVEAEIDVEKLFREHTVKGDVKNGTA